ncbi:DUF2844 domain-containing protein [Trinickia sp.]|uniref:DUF2844 domain-containing protein n=1 Tax=Trinickia sp. TaxID=2571163 RepID=UPI003F81F189
MLNRPLRAVLPVALVAGALWAACSPACAALGGAPMATPSGATAVTTPAPTARVASSAMASPSSGTAVSARYVVRATQLASGTTVREYIGADGTVFGIAWNGPRIPDLPTLLGTYFPQYANEVHALRATRHGRGPVAVEHSDLVVHSGGHMGSFFGQAWLPSALPAGITGADIK